MINPEHRPRTGVFSSVPVDRVITDNIRRLGRERKPDLIVPRIVSRALNDRFGTGGYYSGITPLEELRDQFDLTECQAGYLFSFVENWTDGVREKMEELASLSGVGPGYEFKIAVKRFARFYITILPLRVEVTLPDGYPDQTDSGWEPRQRLVEREYDGNWYPENARYHT